MTEPKKRGRGRPEKPPEEKYRTVGVRFPPDLWEELTEMVPSGERSRFIHELVRRELRRLKRQQERKEQEEVHGGTQTR